MIANFWLLNNLLCTTKSAANGLFLSNFMYLSKSVALKRFLTPCMSGYLCSVSIYRLFGDSLHFQFKLSFSFTKVLPLLPIVLLLIPMIAHPSLLSLLGRVLLLLQCFVKVIVKVIPPIIIIIVKTLCQILR